MPTAATWAAAKAAHVLPKQQQDLDQSIPTKLHLLQTLQKVYAESSEQYPGAHACSTDLPPATM
jgi:hypothetical protein